jgi:hypothetical protein
VTSIEPGRYVCVATPDFAGWLIRKVTHAKTNHVFVVTGPGEIIEARPRGGVCRGTLAEYAGRFAVANTAEPVTQEQRIAVAAEAEKQLATGYNFWADADIGLDDLGWHWRLLERIARVDKRLMCSQMTVACGKAGSLDWLCGKASADQVAPGDLANRPGVEPVTITAD